MNQLLGNLTFHPEHGALSLQSARYVMMSPTLVVELQKKIEAHLPQEVVEIMTQTAFGDGASLASRYRDAFNYSTEQVAHAVSYMLTQSGWGAMSTEMVNLENQEGRVQGCWLAFRGSLRPVHAAHLLHRAWISSGRCHDTIRQRDGRYGSTVYGKRGRLLPFRRQWTSGLSVKPPGHAC